MNRTEALTLIARLAVGLRREAAGVDRLLERIAQHDAAETLRAALLECGAEAMLDTTEGRAS